jgi:hypothetical protein
VATPLAPSRGWSLWAKWLICRDIRRAIRRRTLLHLHIDAAALVTAPEPALGPAGPVLRYIAAKRDAGQLAVRTIADVAQEALDQRAGTPSRSILRPAA